MQTFDIIPTVDIESLGFLISRKSHMLMYVSIEQVVSKSGSLDQSTSLIPRVCPFSVAYFDACPSAVICHMSPDL